MYILWTMIYNVLYIVHTLQSCLVCREHYSPEYSNEEVQKKDVSHQQVTT